MHAIRVTPPVNVADIRPVEMPVPEVGAGDVLVRLHAAALNHRDLYMIAGGRTPATHSFVVGSDGAGVVEAIGAGVQSVGVGERVLIFPTLNWGPRQDAPGADFDILGGSRDGTLAEYIALPAANVYRKPEHFSWAEAAALGLSGLTAYRALVSRAGLMPDETILIHGIGGAVSLAALQIAVSKGARAIVTSSSDEKLARARAMGAAETVNYATTDWLPAVQELTGGAGVEVVLESSGAGTFPGSVTVVKGGGRIVTFSTTTGGMPPLNLRELFWKQASILGTTMGSPTDFAGLLELYGVHNLAPVVDGTFPLAEAAAAFGRMASGEQFGNIVIETA